MALNFVCPGKNIVYPNATGKDIKSGQFVAIGALAAVALVDITAGLSGNVAIEGVYALPKAAVAVSQGANLYWDADGNPVGGVAGSGALTTVVDGNSLAGVAIAAAADTDATVHVKLNV